MATTLDAFADALGVDRLTDDQIATILDLARDVAHATERRFAPVTSYLIGLAAADGATSLEGAVARVRAALAT